MYVINLWVMTDMQALLMYHSRNENMLPCIYKVLSRLSYCTLDNIYRNDTFSEKSTIPVPW